MDLLTSLGLLLSALLGLSALRLNRKLKRTKSDDLNVLNVPIIGVNGEHRRLIFELSERLSAQQSSEMITRPLTLSEEESLRGVKLVSISEEQSSEEPLSLDELNRQSTQSLIQYYKTPPPFQLSPQPAYVSVQVSCHDPFHVPFTICFKDLLHADINNDYQSVSTLYPELNHASAMILVVSAEHAVSRVESERLGSSLQRHIEEYLQAHQPPKPLWLIFVQSSAKQTGDSTLNLTEMSETLIPQLKLDNRLPCLVSSYQLPTLESAVDDGIQEVNKESLSQNGSALLSYLADDYKTRVKGSLSRRRIASLFRQRRWAFFLTLGLNIWSLFGLYDLDRLPNLHAVDEWSVESLEHAQRKLLSAYTESREIFHPLTLHRDQLTERLNLIAELYLTLYQRELRVTLSALNDQGGADHDKVKRELAHFSRALVSFRHQVRRSGVALLKEPSLKQMDLSLRGLTPLLTMSAASRGPIESTTRISHAQRLRLQTGESYPFWERHCLSSEQVFCELMTARDRLVTEALSLSLSELLSPSYKRLMKWRELTCFTDPHSSLNIAFQERLMSSWVTFSQRLDEHAQANKVDLEKLEALRRIDELRDRVHAKCRVPVWPSKFESAWRERVNAEAVNLSKQLSSLGERDQATQQAAKALILWTESQLHPSNRVRVTFAAQRAPWISELQKTFSRPDDRSLRAQIQAMKMSLSQLESLPRSDIIKRDLDEWNQRIEQLNAWLSPHRVEMKTGPIECDQSVLQSADESKWKIFIGDYLSYYLTLEHKNLLSLISESDQSNYFEWTPWSEYRVRVYERDGDFDMKTADVENDDTPLGLPKYVSWSVLPHRPKTLILNAAGTCKVVAHFKDPKYPSWLPLSSRLTDQH